MRLSKGPARSITMVAAQTSLTRQAVTKHLRVLQDVGLVENLRSGRESLFACRIEPLGVTQAYLDRVTTQWDNALSRLKAFVESGED